MAKLPPTQPLEDSAAEDVENEDTDSESTSSDGDEAEKRGDSSQKDFADTLAYEVRGVQVHEDFSRPMRALKPLRLFRAPADTIESVHTEEESEPGGGHRGEARAYYAEGSNEPTLDEKQDADALEAVPEAAEKHADTRRIRRPESLRNLPLDDDSGILQPANPGISTPSVPHPVAPQTASDHHALPHLEDCGIFARGGFGSIHRVNDLRFHRHVAMKVLESRSDHSRARFRVEGQVTAQLQHPNIVPVFEGGRSEDGTPFFTMQLVEGETLKRRAPAMELHDVLQIMLKVCDAVAYAHSRGVIHRDLKPENIMVGDFGQVYVMDWGIALVKSREEFAKGEASETLDLHPESEAVHRGPLPTTNALKVTPSSTHSQEGPIHVERAADDPTVDRPGTVVGTASFMAPEQAFGRVSDICERTDVFGLGAILYYVITGCPLYDGNSTKERLAKARECEPMAPEVRAPLAKVPPGLRAICMRALAKEKAQRPSSVVDLRAQLDGLLRGGWWFDALTFRAGELIVCEGDEGDCAYIISVGCAEAFRKSESGNDEILGVMGPGDVFGETAILTGSRRTASVRATSSLTAMVVTRESIEEQFASDSWAGKIVSTLVRRLRAREESPLPEAEAPQKG